MLIAPVLAIAATVTLDDLQSEVDAGHYEAAARQAESYLELHPGNRDARFLRARALAGKGQAEAAIAAFEKLAADFPLRPEPANNLAVLYAKQGDLDAARKWLEKALATQPAYAAAHRNLGDVYTALADLAYRKALGADNVASKTPLTLLDRFYYAQESVAPGASADPAPVRVRAAVDFKAADAGPPPAADDRRSLMQTVRAWAVAWSDQDFDAYTDFYADGFDPGDGLSRAQWLALRKARLAKPEAIHIHIESPTITHLSKDRVRIEFTQRYESPSYSDQTGKRLLMQRTRAGWRILRETTISRS